MAELACIFNAFYTPSSSSSLLFLSTATSSSSSLPCLLFFLNLDEWRGEGWVALSLSGMSGGYARATLINDSWFMRLYSFIYKKIASGGWFLILIIQVDPLWLGLFAESRAYSALQLKPLMWNRNDTLMKRASEPEPRLSNSITAHLGWRVIIRGTLKCH